MIKKIHITSLALFMVCAMPTVTATMDYISMPNLVLNDDQKNMCTGGLLGVLGGLVDVFASKRYSEETACYLGTAVTLIGIGLSMKADKLTNADPREAIEKLLGAILGTVGATCLVPAKKQHKQQVFTVNALGSKLQTT